MWVKEMGREDTHESSVTECAVEMTVLSGTSPILELVNFDTNKYRIFKQVHRQIYTYTQTHKEYLFF